MLEAYTESERRRAENRILRDMDRLDMPKTEPDEGGLWPTIGMLVCIGILVLLCCAVPGCGTVAGFGNDLSEWSDGIRGSVQADAD
ncbi:MAG: hypothetical protein IPK85_03445 [Gemmatimonadetes bacterium]|nr:hypothetical protein [Gemmatimonadota bacterium]